MNSFTNETIYSVLVIILSLVLIVWFNIAHADASLITGKVLDKWHVTKGFYATEGVLMRDRHYFISLDSSYDDYEVPPNKYQLAKIGEPFQCEIKVCKVNNQLDQRDK